MPGNPQRRCHIRAVNCRLGELNGGGDFNGRVRGKQTIASPDIFQCKEMPIYPGGEEEEERKDIDSAETGVEHECLDAATHSTG